MHARLQNQAHQVYHSGSLQKKQSCIASFNRYMCQSRYAVWFLLLDLTKRKLNSFTYMLWKNISKNRKYI